MSLPEPDRAPLATPPLLVTLCQVRYETQEDLAASSAAKTLLKQVTPLGLDAMTQIRQQQVVLVGGAADERSGQEPLPQPAGWRFSDKDGTTTLTVLTDQLTLETRVYPGWDSFLAIWEKSLTALTSAASPMIATRLGLRYVNRITSIQARRATDFGRANLVDPPFLGPIDGSILSDHVTATEGRATLKFPDGSEALVQHGVVPGSPAPAFVLDIDCFRGEAVEFSSTPLLDAASTLNERALQIFQAAIRPALRSELDQDGKSS